MPYGRLANTSSRTHRLQAFFFSICCLWLVRHCLSTGLFGSLCFSLHLSSGAECSTLTIHLPCHCYQRHMDVSWWPIRNSPAYSMGDILANRVLFFNDIHCSIWTKEGLEYLHVDLYMGHLYGTFIIYRIRGKTLRTFTESCYCHMHTDVCWHRNGTKVLINHFLFLLQGDFIISIITRPFIFAALQHIEGMYHSNTLFTICAIIRSIRIYNMDTFKLNW